MAEQETKNDLITQAKQLSAPAGGFSLMPRTFEEAFRFANLMAESDLLPREFHGKPANVLVAVQLGAELGVSPIQALQNMYVVNGRPAIFGDLLPAIVFNSGLLESIHEEGDDKTATCTVKRKNHEAISRTFTWADAERAKLTERNPTYKAFPKRMLQMRARSWAIRDMFPDVLKGVAVREELEDSIDISPEPERKQITQPQPLKKEAVNAPVNGDSKQGPENIPQDNAGSAGGSAEARQETQPAQASDPKPEEKPEKVAKSRKAKEEPKAEEKPPDRSDDVYPDWLAEGTVAEKKLYNWIMTCPHEEITQQINRFTKEFNWIAKERQLAFLRIYNDRRQGKA